MSCDCPCKCKSIKSTDNDLKDYIIKYLKNNFILGINFLELLNEIYDPFGYNLDGLTSEIVNKMDDYSNIFEKLYEKYKDNFVTKMEPETELAFKIIVDGTSYHITQKFINKPSTPKNFNYF
ncbi:hypothetical protein QJ857_gp0061 [Tupanvirus soda lake]|uniref:Uncharacterized protein n=2 Tax=Tupanvirus TaxID=2094720 RepID=A0A6N1P2C7_9VIRU|nr:hypothetical protein QJ857_gp0061 [Tupanvirus soda lake]QKU35962.1 hypothetical protein [Tupanvirus soda lake]